MSRRKVMFVTSSGAAWPVNRQMPGSASVWGDTDYFIDTDPGIFPDWLVVFSGWTDLEFVTEVPYERRILVCGEPEGFHRYQPKFLGQFGHVITSQSIVKHPGVIASYPATPWFAGIRYLGPNGPFAADLKFADFVAGNPPKSKLCSVVCSHKAMTKGHRQRLAFVERLQQEFGAQIDFFGRDSRGISDKDEALADYRYHIALENSSYPNYWTEKLADPFLRGCFPIYSGCPNIADFFPRDSYVSIDLSRQPEAIVTIKAVLQGNLDREHAAALAESKRRILWEYNVFAMLERLYPRLEAASPGVGKGGIATLLLTDHDFKQQRVDRRFKRYLRGLFA